MHSLEPKNKVFLIEMLKLILRNESLKGEILVPVSICRHVRMKLYIYIYTYISRRDQTLFFAIRNQCPDFHILSKVTRDSSSQRLTKLRRVGYFAFFQLLRDNRRP